MSIVIDANMKMFADRMNITSSRMIQDYAAKSIDEIIEAEAAQGNTKAVNFAMDIYHSPEKLYKVFNLSDVQNKYVLIHNMDMKTREMLLPLLEKEDLVMGLYFFTPDAILEMLNEVPIEELVNVVLGAFSLDQVVMMFTEDDLAQFFQEDKLEKYDVIDQLKAMPPEVMQKFVEGVTGRPYEETNAMDLIKHIEQMPVDKYRDFMSSIDPDIQRQLTFQLTKQNPDYLKLFKNRSYVEMMSTLMKPEMIKPMIFLEKESLVKMITKLPDDLMSIVISQIDGKDFAQFMISEKKLDILQEALMI